MPAKDNEVEVVQYVRPRGKKRLVYAPVGAEYKKMAEGMVVSAEVLPGYEVVLYVRWFDEPEEAEAIEIAENVPGSDKLVEVLKEMIERKYKERHNEEKEEVTGR